MLEQGDTEGFGVGLYLASSIINRMGGKIKVESPGEGQGSRFTISLPRVQIKGFRPIYRGMIM
jgi:signal transduction histidine kinase